MLGLGFTNRLDTYLSAEEYTGSELRFVSQTVRENGSRISRAVNHQANIAKMNNSAGNGSEIGALYSFAYDCNYLLLRRQLEIRAGVGLESSLGFLYNTRNTNNIAQAYLAANLQAGIIAAYSFRLLNLPMEARWEAHFPLGGLMFSPNYGQSYYEIFSRGNYDRNIVPTTVFSTPSLRQQLTLDFTVARTTVRLGYMTDIRQSSVNGLKQHAWSHLFLVGIVRKFSITHIIP